MFQKLFRKSLPKSSEDLKLTRFIIDRFGYRPVKMFLFHEALSHRSIKHKHDHYRSNERLEFLGDSILGAVVADWLFEKYPTEDEGHLTRVKSKIVSRKILSEIAQKLQLKEVIQYKITTPINFATIEGNCLEALIGAVYLDGGYEAAKKCIIHSVYRNFTNINQLLEEDTDYKSRLLIYCQKNKLTINFVIEKESEKNNAPFYDIVVQIGNEFFGKGNGTSKKIAEQEASKMTLEVLGEI